MKKFIVFLIAVGLTFYGASPLLAGGVDNKTNWSAEYVRTFNRNAATDAADIVAYNPAGTIKMENGFYVNLSVQYINKEYTNTITGALSNGADRDSTEPSFIPGLFVLYKQDKYSLFTGFTITGGGGFVDFQNGNYTTQGLGYIMQTPFGAGALSNQRIEAESYYKAYTIGGAYKINEMLSVSLGARFSDAQSEAQGSVTHTGAGPVRVWDVDFEQEADGWCGILGLNISPSDELNIGIRYETKTDLDFEQTVNQNTIPGIPAANTAAMLANAGVSNGAVVPRDLPALLGLGVSYKLTPKIRVETNYTHYFQKEADWNGKENNVSDGYDLGVTVEYTFNEKLKGSLGYLYTYTGMVPEDMTPEAPQLNANTFGGGIAYEAKPGLILTFALGNAFYEDASFRSPANEIVEYSKNNTFLGFGVQYKFF